MAEDLAALRALAIRGLLADLPEQIRDNLNDIVKDKSVNDATRIVDAFKEMAKIVKKEVTPTKPGTTIPVGSTAGAKVPGYFDAGYVHKFVDNRRK